MSTTWIRSESGNLINTNAVAEFAIIGPYEMDTGAGEPLKVYDLYALNVGEVFMEYREKPFRDAHRYLVQHRSREECEVALTGLDLTLRAGGRYFDACEFIRRHRATTRKLQAHRATNGHVAASKG